MAISFYKAQSPLKICDHHDMNELHLFCKTCKKKICYLCTEEEHTSHDWGLITEILRVKKHSLPKECKEIRSKQLPDLKKGIERFDSKIQLEGASFKQNKSVLNSSRQYYIGEINKLFDKRIDECHQNFEAVKHMYKKKRDGLKEKVEYLDMITLALDNEINTLPDHDILDMEQEMRDELEKALSYSTDNYTNTTVFVPGQMNVQTLMDMIGDIHFVSLEEKNDIDRYSDIIYSIKSISHTNAWVGVSEDKYFRLLDRTRGELKTMKTPCFDLIITNSGEFVLTDYDKCIISVLTKDEDEITTIETKPLHPTWICKTKNDDILVTLEDDGDYNLVPTSRRIVQRMTLTGKLLHTYEFREDAKTRLFTLPQRTAENKNTDVSVVNWLSKDSGELVVLHKDGRVKFKYRGNALKTEKFCAFDVECDSKCHILLTEAYNNVIHMLSAEGMYLFKLCQYEQVHPFVISIHGDNLWCGFIEGNVKAFRYTN